jgi:RNA polymerase sigma factor (sigma-70 family)
MLRHLHRQDPGSVHDPDTAVAETVRQALRQLPIELRAVIVLRYYADCSVADTAAVLDVPAGTVKTRTRRALTVLRDCGLIERSEVADAL